MVRPPSDVPDPEAETVLDTLGDKRARTIIEALSEPQTATELSEHCDIPLSTMYRKLDQLVDASLLSEQTQIKRNGQHTTRYVRNFERLTIGVSDEESLHASIDRPDKAETADQRLEELWAQIREET
ncbi:winged helix-turn-helix domain-containing protein [Halalkalirubrum salinum]|uniref:winged helix-turn-helix domain-containing protein n=1 Tax=Halalkalirubrum salinum TaxID=2563889 RepID=UPI0010FB7D35|nr:helix-turn-helix domain-containing protein [Halalkalirubrum salinum]